MDPLPDDTDKRSAERIDVLQKAVKAAPRP
jgi:hypothetical protein